MDYAVPGSNALITNKKLMKKKELSPSVKRRREFLRTHDFSVSLDSKTGEVDVVVKEKHYE